MNISFSNKIINPCIPKIYKLLKLLKLKLLLTIISGLFTKFILYVKSSILSIIFLFSKILIIL